jgi:hypothetical protein
MPTSRQLASDNFNRADSLDLGANWTINFGEVSAQIVSNQVEPRIVGGAGREQYSAISWPNNQYSEWQIVALAAGGVGQFGLTVRCSAVAQTFYELIVPNPAGSSGTITIRKLVSGVLTNLNTVAATPQIGDVWRLQVIGTAITALQNGVSVLSMTDGSISSGRPGITVFSSASITNTIADNWAGGDFIGDGGSGTTGDMLIYNRWCSRMWP